MEGLPLGILLDPSVYHEMYYTAERFLLDYDARVDPTNHSSDYLIQHFQQQWLFGDPDRLPFRWGVDANPNIIWRQAHLSEEWAQFAEIAIRRISVGTFEADCERGLSIQRTIVGAHGTRSETPFLTARLRLHELNTSSGWKTVEAIVLTPQRECCDISQGGQRFDSALMTIHTFEPVIEGMMDRRRDPERGADTVEYTDKRGEEDQAQRMKELMDGNFRTRDAVSYCSEVSGGSIWRVLICLADRGQILVFDQQHEKMYKVVRERVTCLSLSEFPPPAN
jgi:hypothetical protein